MNINKNIIANSSEILLNLNNLTTNAITYLSEVISGNKRLYTIGSYHFFPLYSATKAKVSNDLEQIKIFLGLLDYDKGYIVLPLITSKNRTNKISPTIFLSKQIIISKDSNPKVIRNFLIEQIKTIEDDYNISNLTGELVLKFRPITLNKTQVNRVSRLPIVQRFNPNTEYFSTKIKNPLQNGTIIPLTMDLSLYGRLVNKTMSYFYKKLFMLDQEGTIYQKGGYLFFIKETNLGHILIHEVRVFKDRRLISIFTDTSSGNGYNEFTRVFDKLRIFIQNNEITHYERDKKVTFLKTIKNNKKVNKNIVTFDIETFQKEGKFVSCSSQIDHLKDY